MMDDMTRIVLLEQAIKNYNDEMYLIRQGKGDGVYEENVTSIAEYPNFFRNKRNSSWIVRIGYRLQQRFQNFF